MKIVVFPLLLSACILGGLILEFFSFDGLDTSAARYRIPAPAFSLEDVIHAAAHKHRISSSLVKSIIAAESGFVPSVVSPKGAIGLMQLMPETARELGADPSIPEQNVEAGAHYLSGLLQRFADKKNPLRDAIAAYNAGPGAVERYHGVPPYRETRAYVTRVLRFFDRYEREETGSGLAKNERPWLIASVPRHAEHRRVRPPYPRPQAL